MRAMTLKMQGMDSNTEPEMGLKVDQIVRKTKEMMKDEEATSKLTKMLVMMLIVFLLTEFPSGIFGMIANFIQSKDFHEQCFNPIRRFLNLTDFASSSSNFFVYFIMSQNFRKTLQGIFKGLSTTIGTSFSSSSTKSGGFSAVTSS